MKKRVIFLVDMNAFFISCEMTRNLTLSGRPSAVAGDPKNRTGIILAANYEARRYGVKTAMVLHQALKLCPGLVLVPPDHDFYSLKSQEVMSLLSQYTPILEQNSIDEAWLDMTGCEGLFGNPSEAAQKIMEEIKDKLSLWCSIGISENKFLAKMASDMKKPLGITELWKEDVPTKLWSLSVDLMYGIGKQTAKKLNLLGIQTIGDLAHFDSNKLIKQFGKHGAEMYNLAHGFDSSAVTPRFDNEMKSIGRSITLPKDTCDIEEAKIILLKLTDEIGTIARKYNKKGRTVQLIIKFSDFSTITRQTTVSATYLTKQIYASVVELLHKNWSQYHPVRLLGISLTGFEENCENDQLSLFDLGNIEYNNTKEENLEKAIDAIKQKYGSDKINIATLMARDRD